MTVTNTTDRQYHDGNGVSIAFPTGFVFFDKSTVVVFVGGFQQVEGVNYTITGGDGDSGTVTFTSAPPAGVKNVFFQRIEPYTQSSDFLAGGSFPAEVADRVHDRTVIQIQQVAAGLANAVRAADSHTATSWDGQLGDPGDINNWGKALALKSDGTGIQYLDVTAGGDIEVLTTLGDMVIMIGVPTRLPKGPARARLTMNLVGAVPNWSNPSVYEANDYGIPATGLDDVTGALQAILDQIRIAGGGTLVLSSNGTYLITESLVIGSNTRILGNGATIKAHPDFTGTNLNANGFLIKNYNHGFRDIPTTITELTDHDIAIEGVFFSYNGHVVDGGGAHCINLRYVNRAWVINCTAEGHPTINDLGNLVGYLACQDTVTFGCHVLNSRVGIDHWDGAGNAFVTNCTVRNTLGRADQGIQFTGTGSFGENRTSAICVVTGCTVIGIRNTVSGFASGIIFNANDPDSSVNHGRSIGNYLQDCDNGVIFSGSGGNGLSLGDTFNFVTKQPIMLQTANGHSPNHVKIIDPFFVDCNAVVGLIKFGGFGHIIKGVKTGNTGAATYPYLAHMTSDANACSVHIDSAANGTSGRVLNDAGDNCRVLGESVAYTPVLAFGGAGVGLTYTTQAATYTINGDILHARGRIQVDQRGISTGVVTLSLPLAATQQLVSGLVMIRFIGAAGLTGAPVGVIASGGIVATLQQHGATGATSLTEANIPNGCTVDFSMTYKIPLLVV